MKTLVEVYPDRFECKSGWVLLKREPKWFLYYKGLELDSGVSKESLAKLHGFIFGEAPVKEEND